MKTKLKTILSTTLLSGALSINPAKAQLAPGVAAPNWTLADINGTSHTLFTMLGQGKNVVLDISATWCSPCWDYHQSLELDNFYASEGPAGTNKAEVFLIEGDGSTNAADLNGTGTNTQGNWVAGTPYPIIDPPTSIIDPWTTSYSIAYFPTVYVICNDQKIYEVTTNNMTEADIKAVISQNCPAVTLVEVLKGKIGSIYPNPANGNTLFINYSTFQEADVEINLINNLGQSVYKDKIARVTGAQNYELKLPAELRNGIYFVRIAVDGEWMTRKIIVNK